VNPTLICYATEGYYKQQFELVNEAIREGFTTILSYTREDLEQSEFYEDNKYILDMKRGAGCCLWKPYYILQALRSPLPIPDPVIYVDCGDQLKSGFLNFMLNRLTQVDAVFTENVHINKFHTKRDCFVNMDDDTPEYWDHPQMEAGIIGFNNTIDNRLFIEDWLYWCKHPEVVVDGPSETKNFEGYTNHKCDQSILTNLVIQYKLPTTSIYDVMNYVTFNQRG
jgi:hypothetical protein